MKLQNPVWVVMKIETKAVSRQKLDTSGISDENGVGGGGGGSKLSREYSLPFILDFFRGSRFLDQEEFKK